MNRSAVLRKDILHLTARKAGIHNLPKSGGRKGRPQGCSLCSHRLRRLKPLTPTLSPATHSAMRSMLPCCTSDLNRRHDVGSGMIYQDANIKVLSVENAHFAFHKGAEAGKY